MNTSDGLKSAPKLQYRTHFHNYTPAESFRVYNKLTVPAQKVGKAPAITEDSGMIHTRLSSCKIHPIESAVTKPFFWFPSIFTFASAQPSTACDGENGGTEGG
jgi:hypothetical protein